MTTAREEVILVDEKDNEIGRAEKISAHSGHGRLHRAFSVFILNDHREVLLQRRALSKYHSPGLWANSCCSHPRPGEDVECSARERLQEELGFTTAIKRIGTVLYEARLTQGLVEHELDHIFVGVYNGQVHPNPLEVSEYRWVEITTLATDLAAHPHSYAPWLGAILPVLVDNLPQEREE